MLHLSNRGATIICNRLIFPRNWRSFIPLVSSFVIKTHVHPTLIDLAIMTNILLSFYEILLELPLSPFSRPSLAMP
jgi:hypothetical protein